MLDKVTGASVCIFRFQAPILSSLGEYIHKADTKSYLRLADLIATDRHFLSPNKSSNMQLLLPSRECTCTTHAIQCHTKPALPLRDRRAGEWVGPYNIMTSLMALQSKFNFPRKATPMPFGTRNDPHSPWEQIKQYICCRNNPGTPHNIRPIICCNLQSNDTLL